MYESMYMQFFGGGVGNYQKTKWSRNDLSFAELVLILVPCCKITYFLDWLELNELARSLCSLQSHKNVESDILRKQKVRLLGLFHYLRVLSIFKHKAHLF